MRSTLACGLLMAAAVLASHAAVQRVEKTFEYLPDRFVKREVLPDYFQQYRGSSSEEQGGRRKRKGVYYGCVNKDDVALTFDDGIWLDVPATFFILGESLANPAYHSIARRIAASHTIASHSWDHADYTTLTEAQADEDLKKTSDAISAVVGFRPKYFRPPLGYAMHLIHAIVKLIRKHGMKPVKWNIDSSDWRHVQAGEEPGKSLEIILEALPHTHGPNILQHDIFEYTLRGQEDIITAIRKAGKRFVSMRVCLKG